MTNYYQILGGIEKKSSSEKIEKARWELVKEYQPEKIARARKDQEVCREPSCGENSICSEDCRKAYEAGEEKIRELNEICLILTDPWQRKLYDRFGKVKIEVNDFLSGASSDDIRMLNSDLDCEKDFIVSLVDSFFHSSRTIYNLEEFSDWKEQIRSMDNRAEIKNYFQEFRNKLREQDLQDFGTWEIYELTINFLSWKVALIDFGWTHKMIISPLLFALLVIWGEKIWQKILPPEKASELDWQHIFQTLAQTEKNRNYHHKRLMFNFFIAFIAFIMPDFLKYLFGFIMGIFLGTFTSIYKININKINKFSTISDTYLELLWPSSIIKIISILLLFQHSVKWIVFSHRCRKYKKILQEQLERERERERAEWRR